MSKTTPEGKVKKAIKLWLDAQGAWYFMPVKMRFGRVGVPDFIVCLHGSFVAIEAKSSTGEPTVTQLDTLAAIVNAGGSAIVCSDAEQLPHLLKGLGHAYESVRTQLPARGSKGKPRAPGAAARAAARTLRI